MRNRPPIGRSAASDGAEIAAVVSERFFGQLNAPVGRVAAPFAPAPFSKPLEVAFVPDSARIANAAIALVTGKK